MRKLFVNLYCALITDKKKRGKIRKILNNKYPKKKVLIVSVNFAGGGLETRINNIVNRFHDVYSFSLITKTRPADMRIKPSEYFEHVYSWDEYPDALYKVDILDVHPFGVTDIIEQWRIPSQIKKIYTLHGEASVSEKLDFLKCFHRVYVVSELLRPYIEKNYPQLRDKLFLSKNRAVIQYYAPVKQRGKNILFSITNTNDKIFIQKIIDVIPSKYTVHIIGYFDNGSFVRKNGKIKYHGFVNIFDLFEQNYFDIAFARGGFATMDVVARNIPCLSISSNENGFYYESLSKNNFIQLSDCNFVTRKKFDLKNIVQDIKHIENSPSDYQCRDLLKECNDIQGMSDLYTDL